MTEPSPSRQPIRAPRDAAISCRGWRQEAVLRLLMNCVDPEVAERPEELVIHGTARAARDWEAFHAIVSSLRGLEGDETLTIKAGVPAGVSRSGAAAPRVTIENADGDSSAQHAPLTFVNAADGWTYVGSQSALPVAYEIFAAAAREHFGGTLAGRLVVSGGMGGIGGALPLAATFCGAAFLGIEVDPERIKRRVKTGYCEVMVNDLDEALRILKNAVRKREPASVGLIGNCADLIPGLARRGVVPDLVTDLTAADDPDGGYVPAGLTPKQAGELREADPGGCRQRALDCIAAHVQGLLDLQKLGAIAFDSGNGLCAVARERGVRGALGIGDAASRYLQPLLDQGLGVVTVVALSGEPAEIVQMDRLLIELFPADERLRAWIALAGKHVRYQGLPARTCWLTADQAAQFARALNERVATGAIRSPMVVAAMLDFAKEPAWIRRDSGGLGGQAVVLDGTS